MRITFTLILTHFCLSACAMNLTKPMHLDMTPPEGPPEYQQGWIDGCSSGLSSVNTNINQYVGSYVYTINDNLWQNRNYKIMWKDAYRFCTYFMFSNFMMNH